MTQSLSTTNVLVVPKIREEIGDPDNYSTAGSVIATQSGDQVRFDYVNDAAVLARRLAISADRTYYVRTDGNDSNDGLANTSGGAFLTVQAGLNAIARIDFNGYAVTLDVVSGTFTEQITIPVTTGQATPADFLITSSSGAILTYTSSFDDVIVARSGVRAQIGALTLTGTGGGNLFGIHAFPGATIEISGCEFGSGLFSGVAAEGGTVIMVGDYTVSSGGYSHVLVEAGGFYRAIFSGTITLTGTPAFSGGFAVVSTGAVIRIQGASFSGGATGPRYLADINGVIATAGGGASYLPGDAPGSTATGGVYA